MLLPSPEATGVKMRALNILLILFLSLMLAVSAHAQPADTDSENSKPIEMTAAPATAPTPLAVMRSLRIPLTIDYLALGAAIKQHIYTDNGRAPLWNGSDQCQYLYAENPRFGRAGDKVKLESDGSLMIGVMMAGRCVSPVTWKGIIEAETAPYIAEHLQLKFRITDINLYDTNHQKTLLVGK